jgi:hypothetical protein
MVGSAATKVLHIAPAIESPRPPTTRTICTISKTSLILVVHGIPPQSNG